MTRLILLRGPAAIGKTTLAELLAKKLNNCALVSEDYFRGYLQVKRGENNKLTHKNAGILVQALVDKLMELDNYENVLIEGLFPDERVLSTYFSYAKKKKFEIILFQLVAGKEILQSRNKIERGHIVRDSALDDHLKLFKKAPKQAIVLSAEGSVEKTMEEILKFLKID